MSTSYVFDTLTNNSSSKVVIFSLATWFGKLVLFFKATQALHIVELTYTDLFEANIDALVTAKIFT